MIARTYLERGRPVVVLTRWKDRRDGVGFPMAFGGPARGTPRNVVIRREDGQRVVRPFRGLRKVEGRP